MSDSTLPLTRPPQIEGHKIKKVAILFSGGPAPAANSVISTAASAFLRNGIEVVGALNGYSNLMEYVEGERELVEDQDYVMLTQQNLRRTRSRQGIIIGTARANPGKKVQSPADLEDAEKIAPLRTVYDALRSIGVDALISIGGDDTLKTANKFRIFQDKQDDITETMPVVHLPKTIDNDYEGIDFTFGYFTAVEVIAGEIRNLLADAEANNAYFMAVSMGRSAGWLAYGAAMAGEASLVISVEDIAGPYRTTEHVVDTDKEGNKVEFDREMMDLDAVVKRIVSTMRVREDHEGKKYGVIVLAEGLGELLPYEYLKDLPRDDHGHLAMSELPLDRIFGKLVADEYKAQTEKKKKVTPVTLGYESRCARPQAFDVMLGSQLGVGAYRALIEENLDCVMVSITGQLQLRYVPFAELVDQKNLVTVVRFIKQDSDFHRLARFLETYK